MKTILMLHVAVFCFSLPAAPGGSLSVSNQLASAGYRVSGVDPDTRTWTGLILRSNEWGGLSLTSNTVVELGLFNRLDSERVAWVESAPELVVTESGVVGRGARHEIFLAANLNSRGAVWVRLPATAETSAQYLKSHVLALAYACGGTNLVLAVVKDSTAEIVGQNCVLYQDAFKGLEADVLYAYSADGLMQSVILRAQPPSPESLGLSSNSVQLVAITEIVDGPEPRVTAVSALDPLLEFGPMSMTHGRGFLLRDQGTPRGWHAPHVLKRYETIDGRRFISESVEMSRIQEMLLSLPPAATSTNASAEGPRRFFAAATLLPAPSERNRSQTVVRQTAQMPEREGFVLDWDLVHTGPANLTFRSAATVTYILRHPLHLSGRTVFEPGAVILVHEGPLHIDGTLEFTTSRTVDSSAKVTFSTLNDPALAGVFAQQDLPQDGDYGPAVVVAPSDYRGAVRNVETRFAVPGIVLNLPTLLPTVQLALADAEGVARDTDQLTFALSRRGGDFSQPLTVRFQARVGPVRGADSRGILWSSATIPANEESMQVSVPRSRDSGLAEPIVLKLEPDDEGSYLVGEAGAILLSFADEGMQLLSAVQAPEGMVAWWQAEGDGDDASGNGYNVTNLNAVSFVTGEVNQTFSFNGTSSFAEVTNVPGLNSDLTIEFWVKRQRIDSHQEYIVEQGGDWFGGGSQQNFAVQLHGGDNKLCFTWAGGYRMGGTIIDTTNWHHCAVVAHHGDANPILYIDGQVQTITSSAGSSINLHSTSRPLHIGAQIDPASGWNYYSQTYIDELTLYTACLSPSGDPGHLRGRCRWQNAVRSAHYHHPTAEPNGGPGGQRQLHRDGFGRCATKLPVVQGRRLPHSWRQLHCLEPAKRAALRRGRLLCQSFELWRFRDELQRHSDRQPDLASLRHLAGQCGGLVESRGRWRRCLGKQLLVGFQRADVRLWRSGSGLRFQRHQQLCERDQRPGLHQPIDY